MRQPRWYQREAVDAVRRDLEQHPDDNLLVGLPTGTGKALCLAMLCKELLYEIPMLRITMATHSQHLVEQNAKTLLAQWPDAPVGIFSAGLKKKQAGAPITFCGIQSAAKQPELFGRQHILLVDEAHAIGPGEETNYQTFIAGLKKTNPRVRTIGFSATLFRMKGGMLTNPGGMFSRISYDKTDRESFVQFIREGFLTPLLTKPTGFVYDDSKLRRTGGDFNQKDLEELVDDADKTFAALSECMEVLHDREHWMIFCASIKHVEDVVNLLASWGQEAVGVHSKMSAEQVKANIDAFREGRARIIVNNGMLTTGFDAPFVDAIVLLRLTDSSGLNVQILGRGTRPYFDFPGADAFGFDLNSLMGRLSAIAHSPKKNCRVMDYADNIRRNGPINAPKIPGLRKKGKGEMPIKICPKCGAYNHTAARFCENVTETPPCEHEFVFEDKKTATASDLPAIQWEEPPPAEIPCDWFPVVQVEYDPYITDDKPDMLKVTHKCVGRVINQFVCLDHTGPARKIAERFWKQRRPFMEPPASTLESLAHTGELMVPKWVFTEKTGKYPSVRAVDFGEERPAPRANPKAKVK
jgi:DNA repair protein RadD